MAGKFIPIQEALDQMRQGIGRRESGGQCSMSKEREMEKDGNSVDLLDG